MSKTKTFTNTRIQTKRDTAANWESNNPVLLYGEEIIVDTKAGEVRKKIGDGTSKYTALPFVDEPIRTLISGKVDKVTGKGLSTNDYTTTEKEKLQNIEDGANKYVHPDYDDRVAGLYKITVTDGHVSMVNPVNKEDITGLGIPGQDTTYSNATTSKAGLMSTTDKAKLDGIDEGANKYTHPTYTVGSTTSTGSPAHGKTFTAVDSITTNNLGHVTSVNTKTVTLPTYNVASSTANGLMSKDHVTKLTGIEDGANKYVHPSTHAATMITEDEDHRFVTDTEKSAWNAKADKTIATSSNDGLMSKAHVTKLAGIAEGANKYVHDTFTVGATTSTASPTHGKTFTAIDGITTNGEGHVTSVNTKTVTLPTYGVVSSTANGLMTSGDKTKLDGIAEGANKYVHPSTHAATMITEDEDHRFVSDAEKATWNAKASTAVATTTTNGLMAAADKSKLDGIDANANKYTHPTYDDKSSGLYKITVTGGHVSATAAVAKADITALGIPAQDTKYSAGTGLELSGTTFNHSNKTTAGTAKGSDTKTLAYSGTFDIPTVTFDSEGHVTTTGKTTMTMPAAYSHPSSHAATMITEDTSHRFVTDTQIKAWDAKVDDADLTDLNAHLTNKSNPHAVTKAQVGLSNVTNDAQVKRSEMGVANGVATLDSTGTIPASQLPSFVDDVIEGYYKDGKFHKESTYATVITGETGKIYVDLSTNKTYRWSGSAYVVISETLALGETSSTAYPGNKGKANATAIATINEKLATIDEGANKYTHPSYTARTGVPTANQTPAFGATFTIGQTVSDASGHVTAVTSRTVTIPNSTATSTAAGLMSADDKAKLDGIATGANKFTYTHPSYTATTGVPTANQTPGFGGTFQVNQITSDAQGHVSANTSRTITIPSTLASSTVNGLMSKDDKAKLDGLNNYSHPTYTVGATTGTASPSHGGTFTAVDSVTTNNLGHVTSVNTKTVTLPTYGLATSEVDGLMNNADKAKLDGIAEGANKYVHPSYTAKSSGLYKITVDASGHVSATTAVAKADITGLGIPAQDTNTTYDLAAPASQTNGNVKVNLTAGGSGSGTDSVSIKGTGATTVTTDSTGTIIINSTDNDTHYTSKNIVCASNTATANAAVTGNGVYLNHLEQSSVKSTHKITGDKGITVTSDASGNITISAAALYGLLERVATIEEQLTRAVFYG